MTNKVRRKSTSLDVAKSRWQGLASQDPAMDLGNGLGCPGVWSFNLCIGHAVVESQQSCC
jgi:hypothetical protein